MNIHSDVVTKPLSQAVAELDEGIIHIMSDEEFEAEKKRMEEEEAAKAEENEEELSFSELEDDEADEETDDASEADSSIEEN